MKFDSRLENLKNYPRATQSYILTLFEFVLEYKPKKMLEIGVQNGISTKTFLLAMKESNFGTLVSIDHKRREGILDAEYADVKDRWNFIQGSSHDPEVLQKAKDALEEYELYDMFFVDGDHKMPGIQQDVDDYFPLIKSGGIIIMHDICNQNEQVSEVWDKITWEKFGINWGKARNNVIPGLGIIKKP